MRSRTADEGVSGAEFDEIDWLAEEAEAAETTFNTEDFRENAAMPDRDRLSKHDSVAFVELTNDPEIDASIAGEIQADASVHTFGFNELDRVLSNMEATRDDIICGEKDTCANAASNSAFDADDEGAN